jgi:hypothetical protein
VRFCDHCLLESEQRVHACGTPTRRIRGISWCNNDTVNAIATVVGAATAILLHGVVRNRARSLRGVREPGRPAIRRLAWYLKARQG